VTDELKCAFCNQMAEEAGSSIIMFSPDMDINPIPICTLDQMILIGVTEPALAPNKVARDKWAELRGD